MLLCCVVLCYVVINRRGIHPHDRYLTQLLELEKEWTGKTSITQEELDEIFPSRRKQLEELRAEYAQKKVEDEKAKASEQQQEENEKEKREQEKKTDEEGKQENEQEREKENANGEVEERERKEKEEEREKEKDKEKEQEREGKEKEIEEVEERGYLVLKPVARSAVVINVNMFDAETDIRMVEAKIRQIYMDGMSWGTSVIRPIAYGLRQLQITAVIEDEKVNLDDLIDKIEELPEVQSTAIYSYTKL